MAPVDQEVLFACCLAVDVLRQWRFAVQSGEGTATSSGSIIITSSNGGISGCGSLVFKSALLSLEIVANSLGSGSEYGRAGIGA